MAYLALLALPFLAVGGLINLMILGGEKAMDWLSSRRDRKREALERELDRAQAELRGTILRLASELGMDAHEARKVLIRESYLASERTPDQQ